MKLSTTHLKGFGVALLLASLSGCSVHEIHKLKKEAQTEGKEVISQMPVVKQTQPLVWRDHQWINPKPLPAVKHAPAVPRCHLTHLKKTGVSLQEVAQFITAQCGLQVVFTPDAVASGVQDGQTAVIKGPVPTPGGMGGDALVLPDGVSSGVVSPNAPNILLDNIFWQGELAGFLDLVGSRAGLSHRIDDGRIVFYLLETKTYTLAMLNTMTNSTASISSGSTASSGSEGGSSSISGSSASAQNTTVGQKYDLYSDIQKSIEAMLTPGKGSFWLSASSAMLTVTDVPLVQKNIERYVNSINEVMNRQVSLHVQILNVSSSHNDQFGIDWKMVYNSLSAAGASINNAPSSIEGAVSAGVSILETAGGQAERFRGSSLLVNALSKQGDVSVVTSQASTVTNMTPVPLQMADQTGYVQSSTTNNNGDSGSSQSLQTATITTGFNMTMLPLIHSGGNVQLQVALNISDPPVIRHIETKDGSGYVELPSTRMRSLSQKVNLREGQSLILSGFDQHNKDVSLAGTFTPANPLFGGAQAGKKDRSTMIVIITPTFPNKVNTHD